MAGSGPQQTSPPHAESGNVNQQGELHNLERENHVDNHERAACKRSMLGEVAIDEGVIWCKSMLMKRVRNDK